MYEHSLEFEATGTLWWVKWSGGSASEAEARACVEDFEANYSRFRPTSLVSRLNEKKILRRPPAELCDMLNFGLKVERQTGGAFSIGVGAELERRGYDSDYSFRERQAAPRQQRWIAVSPETIEIGADVRLDLGGFGKGWIIDKLADFLQTKGAVAVFVNAGGDMRLLGDARETIALENPLQTGEAIGELVAQNCGIAASAPNRRQWVDQGSGAQYSHLVLQEAPGAPRTKPQPAVRKRAKAGVFTYAASALLADTLSTCIFVAAEYRQFISQFDVEYLVVYEDGSFARSQNYPGMLLDV